MYFPRDYFPSPVPRSKQCKLFLYLFLFFFLRGSSEDPSDASLRVAYGNYLRDILAGVGSLYPILDNNALVWRMSELLKARKRKKKGCHAEGKKKKKLRCLRKGA